MLIEVSNTLTVENPTPEMVLWCKRNLTIQNPEYAKKSRMNLWLGNTPKVLLWGGEVQTLQPWYVQPFLRQ